MSSISYASTSIQYENSEEPVDMSALDDVTMEEDDSTTQAPASAPDTTTRRPLNVAKVRKSRSPKTQTRARRSRSPSQL